MDEEKYLGLIGKTRIGTTIFTCECGARFGMKIYLSINTSERPDLGEKALTGKLNAAVCPQCKKESEVPVQYIFHDPDGSRFLLVLPEHQRHMEIVSRANLLKEIADTPTETIPDYVVNFSCVFGSAGLRAFLQSPGAGARPSSAEIEELRKIEAEFKEKQLAVDQKHVSLLEIETAVRQREAAVGEREQHLTQREQALATRETKLRERGEKITELEDLLHDKSDELDQKSQALDAFSQQLKAWEARLKDQQKTFEEFGRMLEEQTKKTKIAPPPDAARAGGHPLKDTKPDIPDWFEEKKKEPAASLSSSIEEILPDQPTVADAKAPAPKKSILPVRESDVIDEADLVDEADIIDEKPIVPVPLKEPAEKRAPRPEAARLPDIDDRMAAELVSSKGRSIVVRGDRVHLWARTQEASLQKPVDPAWARLRCHTMKDTGGFPWIIVNLSIRPPKEGPFRFFWLLSAGDPDHVACLRLLEKKFEAEVHLVPKELDRATTFVGGSELTANLKTIIEDVEHELRANASLKPLQDLDEKAFLVTLLEEAKKPFPFHAKYFPDDASVRATLLAMHELSEWTEPEKLRRVIAVYSFPIEGLAEIKARVFKTALAYGLFVPENLWKEVPSLEIPSNKRETLNRQIHAFASLCRSGSDLTREEKKTNWEALLREARTIALPVDAPQAVVALNYVEESAFDPETIAKIYKGYDIDLEKADTEQLRELLGIRRKRADAVLEALYRSEQSLFDDVVKAVMEMDPHELNRIFPVVAETEDLGETLLLEGLEAGRREVKMACAAYVGKLKLRSAIVPLIKMMLEVGEPDWKFVAWILTQYGLSGVRAIEQFIKDPRGQEQKIIYLLAAFIVTGQDKQVEKFADDTHLLVRSMIKNAMETAGGIAPEEAQIKAAIFKELGIEVP
jgi:hypothetical protein